MISVDQSNGLSILLGGWRSSPPISYEMLSVEKLMMVEMKLSLKRMLLMAFQSAAGSPMSRQIDSIAIFTILGGFASTRISTRCCLLMDLTAVCMRGRNNSQISFQGQQTRFY